MSSLTTHLNMITQDRFLALAGLMLGKVSMPYNRERLEAGLVAFFNDSTVRRNLLSSVTAGESRILSLLHTFHSLSQTQLSDLLEYRNHKAFSRTLDRLTDRCLVLFNENGDLELNDSLDYSSVISRAVFKDHLASGGRMLRLTDTLKAFTGALSSARPRSFTSAENQLSGPLHEATPLLDACELDILFHAFLAAARALAVIREEGGCLIVDRNAAHSFFSHGTDWIRSALLSQGSPTDLARKTVSLAAVFDLPYTRKLAEVVLKAPGEYLDRMDRLGFILQAEEETGDESIFSAAADMNVVFSGSCTDVDLFLFTSVRTIDRLVTLSVTDQSVLAGFECGLRLDDMLRLLFPSGERDAGLVSRLEDWDAKYRSFTIIDAIYLECEESTARLLEAMPLLGIHIVRKLSPRSFLMRRDTEDQWRRIIRYMGFSMLSSTIRPDAHRTAEEPAPAAGTDGDFTAPVIPEQDSFTADSGEYRKILAQEIDRKAGPQAAEGYRRLLDSGMLLSPSQITEGRTFPRSASVSGFDYKGKVNLLSSALGRNSFYTITTASGSGVYSIEALEGVRGADASVTLMDEAGTRTSVKVSKIFKISEKLD